MPLRRPLDIPSEPLRSFSLVAVDVCGLASMKSFEVTPARFKNITCSKNEKSARRFSDRSFFVDVRAACPCQKMLVFFQDLEGLTEVFGRMSAGTSGRKLRSLGWFLVSDTCSKNAPSWKSLGKQPIEKRGIKRFLRYFWIVGGFLDL